MDQNAMDYEKPIVKIYEFDENEMILTSSSVVQEVEDYAADALNALFGGINTTKE